MTLSRTGAPGEAEFHLNVGWFGLGWACADPAHLAALPQALGAMLGATDTRIRIARTDGTTVFEGHWRAHTPPAHTQALAHDVPLGGGLTLHVSARAPDHTPVHADAWQQALTLMQQGLECILVAQNDRLALGGPYPELSDREWQVCLALEGAVGEKQIAHNLACSRHTVHSYVKALYRKVQARSRLAVLEHLRKSRDAVRCAAVSGFSVASHAYSQKNGGRAPAPVNN